MDTKTKNPYVVNKPFELDGKKLKQGSKVQLNYLEAGYWLTGGYLTPEHLMAEEPAQASTPQTEAPTDAPVVQ